MGRWTILLTALALVAACVEEAPVSMGRADYAQFCAGCHGGAGAGDGPVAGGLSVAPADLTTLSTRNGGAFPLVEVMSHIDGYTRRVDGGEMIMPEFGPAIQAGRLVRVETADGVSTPTPERLYALARYLETLQE
ncbi:MAG: c-type cytochrome [Paracoccaceae bacterium]|nr:c-type cytochrome [Paracoccaceae bacterium]